MLLAIVQLPSLKKTQKNAFEVAKTITEESDVVIYPITEFIGAVYKKQVSNYDLKFARALRKLYEKNEKNFIAMYKDPSRDRFFVFVRNVDGIESYIFESEEAIPGIVSVLLNFYKNKNTKLFFIVSDSEEENEESRKILNSAIEILVSKNENIHISSKSINYSKSSPSEEDYELLLKRDTITEIIRRYIEKFTRKLKEKRIETPVLKLLKDSRLRNYGVAIITVITLVISGEYLYKEYILKKKTDNEQSIKKIERKNRIDSSIKKKNNFILQILIKNIDKLVSVYSDKKKLYVTSAGRLNEYDRYIIEALPQTGYYSYSIPLLAKERKIEKISSTSDKDCRKIFLTKDSEVVKCKDSRSEINYLIQFFLNSKQLYNFSLFKGPVFLNTVSKTPLNTKNYSLNHSFLNNDKTFSKTKEYSKTIEDSKKDFQIDRGEFKKL